MTLVAIEELSYRYAGGGRQSLLELSLTVEAGELVALAGLSGSGKSTLLRAVNGLVPHFHGGEFAGRVRVDGRDTREQGPSELSAVCGSLFQDPETQTVMGTVRGELAFPLENRGLREAIVAREVEEVALALDIAHLLERSTHELSGGELQRVALAAALAGRPPLLLLDEPTSQLDPVAGDELLHVVQRLNEQWGTTVIVAEHRLERILPAADRVVALEDGIVAFDGDPRTFLEWAARNNPALLTPAAQLFERAGLRPAPTGVKDARATLKAHGLLPAPAGPTAGSTLGEPALEAGKRTDGGRQARREAALRFEHVWHEFSGGRAALKDVTLAVAPGERIALMGRNGAGKSTLLKHAKGLMAPTRGKVHRAGDVALLLQNPTDYLVHDRVGDEAPAAALERAGLAGLEDRHPHDLSGGERQRLALAIVTGGDSVPAVVCLDEPTRGMDRAHKGTLVSLLRDLSARGAAILVATHDTELAAAFAERVMLLGDGAAVADGSAAEILSGGWYFSTETARVLGGAGAVLDPAAGAELLRRGLTVELAP